MKVVITSMRNEADYILEWVSWNLMIGFDKIIIYTNNNDDDSLILLEKLQKIGVIEYFELNPPEGKQPQMYAFNKGMEWVHEHKPEWVCCLDSDEFLVLKYDSNITDYLSRFNADAIAINWKIFGSGGIEKRFRLNT
ncbi:glycosyltransferase family 2 protein [Psychromonas sp. KJ10-2]|uniref:glycosyltransferase family 2 protein n=1 Tax=Psychromonas sp. KJ10-2 TaxID=3391822 RepID=UPI0039B57C65